MDLLCFKLFNLLVVETCFTIYIFIKNQFLKIFTDNEMQELINKVKMGKN